MSPRTLPLLLLVMCSCTIRSIHPAISEEVVDADSSALEGSWEVVDVIEQSLSALPVIDVTVEEAGELILSMSTSSSSISRRGVLANLSGRMILSIQSETGRWHIVRLELSQSGQGLLVFALDAEVLKQARDSGDLAVVRPSFYFDDGDIEIRADQASLSSFLHDNPNAFSLQIASLRRRD